MGFWRKGKNEPILSRRELSRDFLSHFEMILEKAERLARELEGEVNKVRSPIVSSGKMGK